MEKWECWNRNVGILEQCLPFQLRKQISGSREIFVDKPSVLTKGAAHQNIHSFATPRLKHW